MHIAISLRLGDYAAGAGAAAGGDQDFLVFDQFATDVAAPIPEGTPADPGPGSVVAVNDPSNYASISGGRLRIVTGVAALWYTGVRRALGRYMTIKATNFTNTNVGLDNNTLGNADTGQGIQVRSTGEIRMYDTSSYGVVGQYASETNFAIVLRVEGAFYFIDKSGNWELLGIGFSNVAGTLYPAIASLSSITTERQFRNVIVPTYLFVPTPIASDGFSLPSETDGLGHAEGVAGGAGAGGDGIAWTETAWDISGGVAQSDPAFTARVTNGDLESWTSPTVLDDWTFAVSGSTTITREDADVHGGIYAVRFTVDGSNSLAKMSQTTVIPDATWVRVKFWAKSSIDDRTLAVDENFGTNIGPNVRIDGAYREYVTLIRSTRANTDIGIKRSTGPGTTFRIDDIRIDQIALSDLIRVVNVGVASYVVSVDVTPVDGVMTGLVIGASADVAPTTPTTFIAVVADGTDRVRIIQFISSAVTYIADVDVTPAATLKLQVIKRAGSYWVLCNGVGIGSGYTTANSTIVNSTRCGLFSTEDGAQLDNFACYSRGLNGEYGDIDAPTAWQLAGGSIPSAAVEDSVNSPSINTAYGGAAIANGQPWTIVARTQWNGSTDQILFYSQGSPVSAIGHYQSDDSLFITSTMYIPGVIQAADHVYFFVSDGATVTAYRDGVEIGSHNTNVGIAGGSSSTWRSAGGSFDWATAVPRAAIYNVALDESQRTALLATMQA